MTEKEIRLVEENVPLANLEIERDTGVNVLRELDIEIKDDN